MFNTKNNQTVLTAFTLAGVAFILGCPASYEDTGSPPPSEQSGVDSNVTQPAEPAADGGSNVPLPTDIASGSDPDDSQASDAAGGGDSDDSQASAFAAPSDIEASCTVDEADFAKWFQSGRVTQNGFVTPADSLQPLDTLCDFYSWSWRMFLWQMSTTSDGLVFNSAPFFDLNESNELVSGSDNKHLVRGGKREEFDRTGQAGVVSGVLMSQGVDVNADGSLVYYAIHVNDVYAYMASGVNSDPKGLPDVTSFPTTVQQRDDIVGYAIAEYGKVIKDSNTLAMEMKSSWVKANDSMDLKKFITVKSDIPKYVKSSDQQWTWDGTSQEKNVTLACVGYHIVGSTLDHPEMIWATFEHNQNAPDANYYYVNSNGDVVEQKNWNPDGTPIQKDWLFMDGKSKEQSMNQMLMELKGNNILATPGNSIGPGNTMRTHPWGGKPVSASGSQRSAQNNTAIISSNNNITAMLADGDVRANYFLVGATWTDNGVPGVGLQIPEVAGSLTLANSTMETYFQFKNCFDCHNGGKLSGLSHIFGNIKPLAK